MNVRAAPLSALGFGIMVTVSAALVSSCHGSSPRPGSFTDPPSPTATRTTPAQPRTPSRTPGPTATTAPQEQTVAEYVHAVNRAFDTGRVGRLRELGAPSCESCQNVLTLVRGIHSGGHVTGDPHWKLASAHLVRGEGTVETYIKLAKHTVVASKGATPHRVKAGVVFYEFTVARREGRWVVTKIIDAT